MWGLTPGHLLVAIVVFVLLFGAKKLPEMARSLGQSARVLKSEMRGMQADDEARASSGTQTPALPAPSQAQATQAQAAPQSQSTQQARAAEGPGTPDTSR